MDIGDKVRLVGIPPNLPVGDADLQTEAAFRKCLGHVFTVVGFNEVGLAELTIELVTGSVGETISVESDFLEVVSK
jgi:hypothetical protein